MDTSQFFLDPAFCFDPNSLGQFSEIEQSSSISLGQSEDASQTRRKTRIRASRACIPCRSQHMKCDSVEPTCTRCQIDEKTCVYAKSRRGGSNRIDAPQRTFDRPFTRPSAQGSAPRSTLGSDFTPSPPGPSSGTMSNFGCSDIEDFSNNDPPKPERLLSRYYEFFHNAHPILLPRRQLCERLSKNPDSLQHLFPVLEFIGSIFISEVSTDPFRQRAHNILNSSNLPLNGFSVQALMMFALALHCSDEYKIADQYLEKAIDIALSINMHRQSFAMENGEGDPSLEESWRRTWWSIFMLDGIFAAISHYPTHRLQGMAEEVDLPCEDWEYEEGRIPPPRTLQEYDNREFSDEEVVYSSLTYFIDICRILSSTLAINYEPRRPGDGSLAAADAKFVNWSLYLPKTKQNQEIVREDQKTDEVMFLAHVVMNTLKLLLHRPHSRLAYSSIETQSKCTPPSPSRQSKEIILSITLHTAKSLEALSTTINLFALPSSYLKHSPLTTCSLALAIMAQVAACNNVLRPGTPAYKASRDGIRLGLGALRASMECWFMASRSVREVVSIARELLSISSPSSTTTRSVEPVYMDTIAFSDNGSNGSNGSNWYRDEDFGHYPEISAQVF